MIGISGWCYLSVYPEFPRSEWNKTIIILSCLWYFVSIICLASLWMSWLLTGYWLVSVHTDIEAEGMRVRDEFTIAPLLYLQGWIYTL